MINNRSELIKALNTHKNKQANHKGATATRCRDAVRQITSAVPLNQVIYTMPRAIAKQINIQGYNDYE